MISMIDSTQLCSLSMLHISLGPEQKQSFMFDQSRTLKTLDQQRVLEGLWHIRRLRFAQGIDLPSLPSALPIPDLEKVVNCPLARKFRALQSL